MGHHACPGCNTDTLDESGRCARCQGRWFSAEALAPLLDGKLPQLRRLVGKGPLTSFNCADCRAALKSIDVPGPIHEGDLFWGLESARPTGTAVAEGCPRCGGIHVGAADLARAGGERAFLANLAGVARKRREASRFFDAPRLRHPLMARPLVVHFVLLATLVAGCAGPPAAPDGEPPTTSAPPASGTPATRDGGNQTLHGVQGVARFAHAWNATNVTAMLAAANYTNVTPDSAGAFTFATDPEGENVTIGPYSAGTVFGMSFVGEPATYAYGGVPHDEIERRWRDAEPTFLAALARFEAATNWTRESVTHQAIVTSE